MADDSDRFAIEPGQCGAGTDTDHTGHLYTVAKYHWHLKQTLVTGAGLVSVAGSASEDNSVVSCLLSIDTGLSLVTWTPG